MQIWDEKSNWKIGFEQWAVQGKYKVWNKYDKMRTLVSFDSPTKAWEYFNRAIIKVV